MGHLLSVLLPLAAGLIVAFGLRSRASASIALGAGVAAILGNVVAVVFC